MNAGGDSLRRILAGCGVVALVAASVVANSLQPSTAQPSKSDASVRLWSSASPGLPAHSVQLGALPPGKVLAVEVSLSLPDPSALRSFLEGLYDRGSPEFHHFLRGNTFGELFGPTAATVAEVRAALRAAGLSPGATSPDRLLIPVRAPVALIERALGVKEVRYRLPDGAVVFTDVQPPKIAASVAPFVSGVFGLNDLSAVRPSSLVAARQPQGRRNERDSRISGSGPAPCAAASDVSSAGGALTDAELAAHYGMDPLYALGDFGQGVRIAIAEFESDSPTDVSAFQACYGFDATVNYIPVKGGAAPGPGEDAEAAMDIENVIGLAPEATIDVYQAPSGSNANVLAVYSAIVNATVPDPIVSTSWGECEPDQDSSDATLRKTEQALFEQAVAQGQTVFAAAGDSGSTDCYGDPGTDDSSRLTVDDPASQPYVVAVGGTSVSGASDTVWNDSGGAGGGGVSSSWCMPGYQDEPTIPGVINRYSEPAGGVTGASCPAGSYMREVPDVSADADPATGYVVYWNGRWLSDGGTSGASPLWAAGAALVDASPYCAEYASDGGAVEPQDLYAVASSGPSYYGLGFDGVTAGDNDWVESGYTGGLYPATAGYNFVAGLGAPRFAYANPYEPGLAALLCAQAGTRNEITTVSSVEPGSGPSTEPTQVRITGTGFLALPGADRVVLGSSWVPATCTTTTSCTATLPPHPGGPVSVRVSVQEMRLSPQTGSDEFIYVPRPAVTLLTPAFGSVKAGTKVTVWGRHFVGTVSVHFGTALATGVHVISSGRINLTAPAGSRTVQVEVTATGGSSRAVATSRFSYWGTPAVSGVSPAGGNPKGGTRVVIRGRNFAGVKSVLFGRRQATGVHRVSSSELTAIAPAGAGTVYVRVRAVGGVSPVRGGDHYRY